MDYIDMRKLKQKQIAPARQHLLSKQQHICPLCLRRITDAVLDHCHTTGHVRSVLCRECNSLEGKIQNFLKSYGVGIDANRFLSNLIPYWERDYSRRPLHPLFKTPTDKKIRLLKKRMKRAKLESTRKRLKEEIRSLS